MSLYDDIRLTLKKIHSKLIDYRKRQERVNIIKMEEIKAGKPPFLLKIFGIIILGTIFLLILSIVIPKLEEKFWVPIILSLQLIFILIQLLFIRTQTKFFRVTHQPELILTTKNYCPHYDPYVEYTEFLLKILVRLLIA